MVTARPTDITVGTIRDRGSASVSEAVDFGAVSDAIGTTTIITTVTTTIAGIAAIGITTTRATAAVCGT